MTTRKTSLIAIFLLIAMLLGVAIPLVSYAAEKLTVYNGKVCSLTEPLGIEGTPTFSWTVKSTKRGDSQKSYRLILADSKEEAKKGNGNLWDSGVVTSSRTTSVVYGGPALATRTSYYWRVTVESTGGESATSEVFRFSTGVGKDEWTGKWIGMPFPRPTLNLSGAKWIWYTGGGSLANASAGAEYFRFAFDVPAGKTVSDFELVYTADDSAEVFINGSKVSSMSLWSDGTFYQSSEHLVSGKNVIAIAATNASAGYGALIAKAKVSYSDGTSETYTTGKSAGWRVLKGTPAADWKSVSFDDSSWKTPDQELNFGASPWGTGVQLRAESSRAAVILRKEFSVGKEIKEALVSLCGLGFFDLSVNGKKADESVLNPFITQYDEAVYYRTFDLTELLNKGENALAVELGNSYYNEIGGVWNWPTAAWRDDPKLMLRLDIRYTDGSSDTVVSDTDWLATDKGPITANSMYYGDVYDARLEMPGFDKAGFDDSAWEKATVMAAPIGKLEAQMKAPMGKVARFTPAEIVKLGEGSYRVESPEMVAGWVFLKNINQEAGDKITLTYGQKLNADGSVLKYGYTDGELAGWYPHAYFQQDIYYSAGKKNESYEPKFSYKGFEYVQIDGYKGELRPEDVVIYRVSNDIDLISEFTSSNELLNALHKCMLTALWDNHHGEHCDPMLEKNGWLGDANVSLTTLMFNFDMAATLPGFIELMEDGQDHYGAVPQMVPAADWGLGNIAVWNTIFIYGVEDLENYFGTFSYSEEQYQAMRKMATRNISELRSNGWVWYDNQLADWVAPMGGSNPDVPYNENMSEGSGICGTAYVYGTLRYMKELAERMGKTADAKEYGDAMTKVYDAFNKKFYNEAKGYYETKTWSQIGTRTKYRQTSNLVPLAFGLVPEDKVQSVVESLVKDIEEKDYHLDTGCVGTRYILPVLCDYGYGEVAYRVATQTTYPSWGFWIERGAKSTWEMWENTTRSFDHYFLGTYDEWFFTHLGGIKKVDNGYESFVIDPDFVGDLTDVNVKVNTVRGQLVSAWKKLDSGKIEMTVTVPFGATATVKFPTSKLEGVILDGKTLSAELEGVKSVDTKDGASAVIGSGSYVFTVDAEKSATPVYRLTLKAALDKAKSYLTDDRYASDRAALTKTVASCEAVYNDEDATQVKINEAVETLEKFLEAMIGSETRNALRSAIAESRAKYKRAFYSADAWKTYRKALLEAEGYAADRRADDETLAKKLTALKEAEKTLSENSLPNLAKGSRATASSTHEDSYWKWGLSLLLDGNRANTGPQAGEYTGYCSSLTPGVDHAEWVMLDLGKASEINTVVIYPGASYDGEKWYCYGMPDAFKIEVSADGKSFTTVYENADYPLVEYGPQIFSFDSASVRYVRLTADSLRAKVSDNNSYRLQLSEMEVYSLASLEKTDTTALSTTVGEMEAVLSTELYGGATDSAKVTFDVTLAVARSLVGDEGALPEEVTKAIDDLKTAKEKLAEERRPADTVSPDTPDTPGEDIPDDGKPQKKTPVGLIVGIVLGVIVLVGAVVFVVLKKKK